MRLLIIAVRIAFRALRRNTLRSLLTILGIIIGVAAVIAMVSISQGASVAVQEQIARMGNNLLVILPGSVTQGGVRTGAGGRASLRVNDAKAMQRECPAVSAVTYLRRQVQQVVVGNQNWSTSIFGVTPEYQTVRDWPLVAGRFITKQDDESGAAVALLGQTVVENLFGPGQTPLEQVVRINNVPFRVVGILTPKGQSTQGADQDDAVLIPFTTAERKVMGAAMLGTVGSIMVSAVSPELIPEAQRQITTLLRERHRLKSTQDNDFQIRNLADVAATAQSTSQSMSILLASVASVSLVVGGIGIMNIMLVSVTERTREIGIRMAVGAKRRDILTQFLLEAVVLSTLGGLWGVVLGVIGSQLVSALAAWPTIVPLEAILLAVVFSGAVGAKRRDILTQFLLEAVVLSTLGGFCGVVLGVIGSQLVSALAAWPTIVPLEAILLAVVFSGAVGVFFGFYPARKAAYLDPIEALRYE